MGGLCPRANVFVRLSLPTRRCRAESGKLCRVEATTPQSDAPDLFGECVMGDFTWTGSNSNSWSDAGNWTPGGGPPGGADNVTLFADGELPVVGGVSAAVDVFTEGFAPFGNPIA